MTRLLAFLGGHAPRVLFVGVFIGLAVPDLAALCRPLLTPAVVLMLLATLLRVDWGQMAVHLRRPLMTAALVAWLLIVSPVATWLLLSLAGLPDALETALVLMAAAPPILSAAAIAIALRLDAALAVVVGLACTMITPLTLPPLALELLGLELTVGVGALMLRLGLVVAVAFLGALLVRRLVGRARLAGVARELDGLVVLLMLIFAVAVMDGVTATLASRPGVVALWLAAAFVANPALQLLGFLAFARLGIRQALTVGILSGNCNMGLILAALPADSDADVALYFALAQLPMYMLPALLLPLYRRLLSRAGAAAPAGR